MQTKEFVPCWMEVPLWRYGLCDTICHHNAGNNPSWNCLKTTWSLIWSTKETRSWSYKWNCLVFPERMPMIILHPTHECDVPSAFVCGLGEKKKKRDKYVVWLRWNCETILVKILEVATRPLCLWKTAYTEALQLGPAVHLAFHIALMSTRRVTFAREGQRTRYSGLKWKSHEGSK